MLMLQAEVAERIAAPPGRMSYLSVFVQYHATVRVALRVPPEAFEPAPKVASAVVVLEPHADASRSPPEREPALWGLVQSGFRERRKMLRNVLARQLRDAARTARPGRSSGRHAWTPPSRPSGIAGDRRPQTLSVEDWLAAPRGASGERPRRRCTPVVRLAPAKLNLTLAVARHARRTASTTCTR